MHPLTRISEIFDYPGVYIGEGYLKSRDLDGRDDESQMPCIEDHVDNLHESLLSGKQACGMLFCTENFPFATLTPTDGTPKDVTEIDPDALQAQCVQSPFGDLKHAETKIDTKVRDAWETKNVVLTEDAQAWIDKVVESSSSLFGDQPLKAKFDKLNLYLVDGFFQVHQDTPRVDRVGTLLVFLPTVYEGGKFHLTISERTLPAGDCFADACPYDWKSQITTTVFFGECPHEVTPVISGHRITLSFHLMVSPPILKSPKENIECSHFAMIECSPNDSKEDETQSLKRKRADDVMKCMDHKVAQKLGHDVDELLKEQSVGFLLRHKYSYDEFDHKILKSEDALFNKLFPSSKYSTTVWPVVVVRHDDHPIHERSEIIENSVYRLTAKDWDTLMKGGTIPKEPGSILFFGSPWRGVCVHEESEESCEYTGNESRDGYEKNWYLNAAFIIHRKISTSKDIQK